WSPAPIAEVVAAIEREKPDVVFAPHVETASGMLLPDDYVKAVSEAVHAVGGLFVLDCIASGAVWASMTDLGVDILISAPQKGWSGSPCAGYVMLGQAARKAVEGSTSSSFSMDLKKWLSIADEYEAGRSPYHATMPTDALTHNVELMRETEERGYDKLESAQKELGERVRAVFAERGLPRWPRPNSPHPAWSSSTPTTRSWPTERASRKPGCRSRLEFPCSAANPRTSRRSASGCSASTSSATSMARSLASSPPSTRSA